MPEDWDFRTVREDQLDAVILYEYARSSKRVIEVFQKWHKKKFRCPKKNSTPSTWEGQTVGALLGTPHEQLPSEVATWLETTGPAGLDEGKLLDVSLIGPQFPTPFLKLPMPATLHIKSAVVQNRPSVWQHSRFAPILWLRNSPPPQEIVNDVVTDDTSFLRHVVIDLRFSRTSILEDFKALLEKLDNGVVKKLDLPSGKKAIPPWFQLKELAAYRLARVAGMKHERVQAFVKERLRLVRIDGAPDVLPIYAKSSFSEAISSAERRIQTLFGF